ncbi:MAG TPA: universal stress protein [Mucilaginibacter sp.]|jgi:nucleotide-binding universal stress UspA family protein|nr:universal stress protein [Mucilaginibacter sp.]
MKTILVLTDLSKKAENAALYAIKLAEKTFANIILFHLYEEIPAVNVPEAGSWVLEDYDTFKKESTRGLLRLKERMLAHNLANFKPAISWFNDIGPDLASTTNELIQSQKVDLIVMGARGDNTVSHLLYGSDAYEVVNNVHCPVLLVPEDSKYEGLGTIVFANDFKKDYSEAIQFITYLARLDNAHIVLTHFGPYDSEAFKYIDEIKAADEYANVSSHFLPLENFREQLTSFAAKVNASVVVMIHHHHISLDKIFTGSRSRRMLDHKDVPLLVLPD